MFEGFHHTVSKEVTRAGDVNKAGRVASLVMLGVGIDNDDLHVNSCILSKKFSTLFYGVEFT